MEYSHNPIEPVFPAPYFGQRMYNGDSDPYFSRDVGIELKPDEDMELESETNL